jgi:hypothetical protein
VGTIGCLKTEPNAAPHDFFRMATAVEGRLIRQGKLMSAEHLRSSDQMRKKVGGTLSTELQGIAVVLRHARNHAGWCAWAVCSFHLRAADADHSWP